MPSFTLLQTNFTAGEISPKLRGRVDIARYANAVETMENAYPLILGGAKRRPGLGIVRETKTSAKRSRLIPYVFNASQAYMLEVGDGYMRVYKDGAIVEASPGVPYEIASPYAEADLAALSYAQSADTMLIAHLAHAIRRLRRLDHNDWTLAQALFDVEPFEEIGTKPAASLTLSAATVGTGRTFTAGAASFLASDVGREITYRGGVAEITGYTSTTVVTCTIVTQFPGTSIASGEWALEGSPQTTCTPGAKDPVGTATTLTLGAAGWRSADVGKHVKINGGLLEITGISSDTIANATIKQALSATVAAPALSWSLEVNVWNAARGYPRTVAFFQQRLLAAGSIAQPQTIWMSRTGAAFNFEIGTRDDDAAAFTIATNRVNQIQHIESTTALIALTSGSEVTMRGGQDTPLTPTSIQVQTQSELGCATAKPAKVGNEVLFVQRSGRKVRAMSYRFDNDAFTAPDVSLLADHILEAGIVEMAYQREPDPVLWCVMGDGTLSSLTLDREQDVIAWARHSTDGAFESVATLPGPDGDEVWFIVRRTVNGATKRYVERFSSALNTDSAITGTSGPGAATWAGLDHLEGEEVAIVADGVVMPRQTVSSGQITLPRTANTVEIGRPYTTTIKLLPIEAPLNSTVQGKNVRLGSVVVRLLETQGCTIGGTVVPFRRFGDGVLNQPVAPFTGDKEVDLLGWEKSGGAVTIVQDQPLAMHVLAVVRKVTVNA